VDEHPQPKNNAEWSGRDIDSSEAQSPQGGRRRAGSIRHSLAGNAANLPRQRHKLKPKNLPFAQGLLATSLGAHSSN